MIERKDVWKTEGFPIWRIETGKLLQKFDAVLMDAGIVHKSASVVCSILPPFFPVLLASTGLPSVLASQPS